MDYYISNCLNLNLCKVRLCDIKCGDVRKQIIDSDECCIDDDENIKIFLKGYCTAFAIALNKNFGYDIYKIKNGNHYFCKVNKDNKDLFIDVRGIMDKAEDCLDFFNSTIDDIELDSNNSCFDDEYIEIAVNYAEALIEKYKDYYRIK